MNITAVLAIISFILTLLTLPFNNLTWLKSMTIDQISGLITFIIILIVSAWVIYLAETSPSKNHHDLNG